MSLGGHFNKSVFRDKRGREIKHESDFLSTRLRHSDGTYRTYRNGKLIATEDAPLNSKFHTPTETVTIVAEAKKEDAVNRVEKRFDVNAPAMKL
jgi:hypothetical protein